MLLLMFIVGDYNTVGVNNEFIHVKRGWVKKTDIFINLLEDGDD